ncbi:MAG: L-lysine 6-transaminase [Candidatus Marinimicrobia bacterium]|jgi:L-lysine 6-transaminase|nr:L-lysine 6-transaminase [Candidatus Neomarinimicrobiota bacterium]
MTIDSKNVRTTLKKHILADGYEPVMDMEKSHGSWLVDERDGSEYLDMFSMFASGAVGYNHPDILAGKDRLAAAALYKPTLSDIYNVQYAEFVEAFSNMAIPEYLPHTFFIEGGALGVENALKVAFDWKVRKNMENGKGEKGGKIIHFKQAFHGRTGYTLSLTNTSDPRKTMYFPKFDWPRIDNPKLSFPLTENRLEEVKLAEKSSLDQIKAAITNNPDEIAALIIEPIQGEGGDNHFRDEFFVALRQICDENEMLFIMDEVQTGIGITGKWWAHQYNSVKPDIISFGKKTQVCGLLAGKRVEEVDKNVFSESSRINSTFGGNLADMVRFHIILEIIEKENLIENAKNMGVILKKELQFLSEEFPAYVTNPRGLGLFAAFDLPSQTERDKVINGLLKNKLLMLPSGDEAIRFRPHLNVTSEDLKTSIDIIKSTIKATLN